nr:hypothetical protein [Fimbriimonadaceae bacterium]
DVSSQEVTWTFEKSRWTGLRYSTFLCVVSLHDGTFLCGSADGEVVVLDREGKVLREALSHEGPTSLAQSADGTLFGSDGYGLTKWDPESLTSEVLLPDVRIYSLACLGERVIFRSDCEVWAWSRSEVIRKRIPPGPPSLATSSAFGGLILVIDGEDIAALNPNLEVVSEFRVGDRTPVCLQVDGGDQLAIGYRDGSVDLVSLSQIM